MAPHVTTVLTVARTGSRVVRYLIRPARKTAMDVQPFGHDPWLLAEDKPNTLQGTLQDRLQRGANLTRRGLGLLVVLVLGVLGTLLLGGIAIFLMIFMASGSDIAGWLLGLTLLLGTILAIWTARRAFGLIQAQPEPEVAELTSEAQADEANLLALLRQQERALPRMARDTFLSTVIATRDALRLTADDQTLQRDTFDARQAAREDLPELMAAYQAVPRSTQSDQQLLEQLHLIKARMGAVTAGRMGQQERALSANGRYLRNKYQDAKYQDTDHDQQDAN